LEKKEMICDKCGEENPWDNLPCPTCLARSPAGLAVEKSLLNLQKKIDALSPEALGALMFQLEKARGEKPND
jgi:hypothetical protein